MAWQNDTRARVEGCGFKECSVGMGNRFLGFLDFYWFGGSEIERLSRVGGGMEVR